jgi:recombinational DNA repair protein (RecF pathway)
LALSGYAVQLQGCALCERRLPEEETLFSAEAGGLVCAGCRVKAGGGRMISVRAVKVLRYAAASSLEQFAALRIDDSLAGELERCLGDALRIVLDRDPSSARYADHIHRLGPAASVAEPGAGETLRNSAQS